MKKQTLLNQESLLFLGFMVANGFNPSKYHKILELFQSVPNSISQHINQFEQCLLSENVNYSDLEKYNTNGALGHLDRENGIIVSKTKETDKNFSSYQLNTSCEMYNYPKISEFDSVIAYHKWDDLKEIEQLQSLLFYYNIQTHYIGFMNDTDDNNLVSKVNLYKTLLEAINKKTADSHEIVHDTIKRQNKELYLIKKK